jgi:hypothetical protein
MQAFCGLPAHGQVHRRVAARRPPRSACCRRVKTTSASANGDTPPTVASLPLSALPPSAFAAFSSSTSDSSTSTTSFCFSPTGPLTPPSLAPAIVVPPSTSIASTIAYIRAALASPSSSPSSPSFAPIARSPDRVFVASLPPSAHLSGHVLLSDLLLAPDPTNPVSSLLRENTHVIRPTDTPADAARALAAAGATVAPVVDAALGLVGLVAADDLAAALIGDDDMPSFGFGAGFGVGFALGDPPALPTGVPTYFDTPVAALIAARAPWLVALLILQSASTAILSRFSDIVSVSVQNFVALSHQTLTTINWD